MIVQPNVHCCSIPGYSRSDLIRDWRLEH